MEQESAGETEDTNVNVAADVPEITYASTDDAKQTTDMNAQSVTEMDMEEESNTKEDSKKTVTIEDVSKKYGAQAPVVMSTYQQGQDVEKFDAAYQIAYNMGKSGVSIRYAKNSDAVSFLTDIYCLLFRDFTCLVPLSDLALDLAQNIFFGVSVGGKLVHRIVNTRAVTNSIICHAAYIFP